MHLRKSFDWRKALAGMIYSLLLPLLAGCQTSSSQTSSSLFAGNTDPVVGRTIGDRRVEASDKSQQFLLSYHRRGMDLMVHRFGQVRLDTAAEKSADGGRRILLEELQVTLDLSTAQWPRVFTPWFCRINGLPANTALPGTAVRIAGRAAWEYTWAAAEEGSGSRFWRVYLIPCGRLAYVVRSAGWGVADDAHYRRLLDEVAASLNPNKMSNVW
jgi:hypothetical protein